MAAVRGLQVVAVVEMQIAKERNWKKIDIFLKFVNLTACYNIVIGK